MSSLSNTIAERSGVPIRGSASEVCLFRVLSFIGLSGWRHFILSGSLCCPLPKTSLTLFAPDFGPVVPLVLSAVGRGEKASSSRVWMRSVTGWLEIATLFSAGWWWAAFEFPLMATGGISSCCWMGLAMYLYALALLSLNIGRRAMWGEWVLAYSCR